MEAIALLVFLTYFILVGGLIYGNFKIKALSLFTPKKTGVSVLIPFRNEAQNLTMITDSLSAQSYPTSLLEFIFINDHSSDGGEKLIEQLANKDQRFRLINLTDLKGKKPAIEQGVEKAKHELILTSDADCSMGENWLKTMQALYENKQAHLVIGPVQLKTSKNFIGKLMKTEFSALVSSTSGACGINHPFMCNGANLLFCKTLFQKLKPFQHLSEVASGDDVFLLHALKKKYGRSAKIHFANYSAALVSAKSINGFSHFIQQRIRWAQKSKHYKDLSTMLIGGVIFLANLMMIVILIAWMLGKINFSLLITYFILKWSIDFGLMISSRRWLKTPMPFFYSFFLSLVYPFYIIGIALLSLLLKVRWKGRKI